MPNNNVSLLRDLIRLLAESPVMPETLEACLEHIFASGTRAASGVVSITTPSDGWKVVIRAGPGREELARLRFDLVWKGGLETENEHYIALALPLPDSAGLLVLAAPEVQPDELALWETVAALFAMAMSREPQRAPEKSDARERLRSEVMATLSHELRTPLSTIKGYATALMLDEVDWEPEERQEFLQFIDEECDNMQMMIGDLMDSALLDAGQLRIEPEPVRLPMLVEEIVNEIQSRTQKHRFAVNFPIRFPILKADPMRIKQVLRNILDNAVKYSPTGGLIVIGGEVRSQVVLISIADPGIGISPEHLNSLFEKYFRIRSATGYHVPGTGLGLPLARTIVEAHGGQIWAASRVGHGTTISFTLPLYDVESGLQEGGS